MIKFSCSLDVHAMTSGREGKRGRVRLVCKPVLFSSRDACRSVVIPTLTRVESDKNKTTSTMNLWQTSHKFTIVTTYSSYQVSS